MKPESTTRTERTCVWCEQPFVPEHGNARYCSDRCRTKSHRKQAKVNKLRYVERHGRKSRQCASCQEYFQVEENELYCPACRGSLNAGMRGHRASSRRVDRHAMRHCLICNEKFWSEGPWNRRCRSCSRRLGTHAGREIHHSSAPGAIN